MCIFASVKTKQSKDVIGQTFDQVYLDNFERLCYHAFCITGNKDDAKDIVNDVFCFLYEEWVTYSSRPMNGFLLTLVHNASIDYLRHRFTHRKYEQYVMAHEEDIEHFSDYEEKVQRVLAEVEKMPEQMRRVFTSCYVKGMKYKEVAEEMNITINTVKTNIFRGLKALRTKLSDAEFMLLLGVLCGLYEYI